MTPITSYILLSVAALVGGTAHADDAAARKELTPTGKLRVAIAVGPAPSGIYAIKDAASGQYRGVTIDLSAALAKKLGVAIEYIPYLGSGEIQGAAGSGAWDVSFMPVDEERKKFVDFGSPYHLLQSTYLIAPGSKIMSVDEVNTANVRVGGAANTATFRAAQKASPQATFVTFPGVDAAIKAMQSGEIDAIALSRE